MMTSRTYVVLGLALATLSCKKDQSMSGVASSNGGSAQFEDICVAAGGAVGSIPAAYQAKNAAGSVDNSDFPSVPIDDNTLAVATLYDNPNWQGKGKCTVVLTKNQTSVTLVNGTYLYQYNTGFGALSRAKSIKLFYLANGSNITFSAGGYNPSQIVYLAKPTQCYDWYNQYAYLIAGTPYCNPTKLDYFLSDANTSFTVSGIGMMGSLWRVAPGPGITVTGAGKGEQNFENVITKISVTTP